MIELAACSVASRRTTSPHTARRSGVFRRFAADYLAAHGASMLPSHQRASADILACRTAALGGQLWQCDSCGHQVFSFRSCKNRSCPKCNTAQTQQWLEHRQAEMLPVRSEERRVGKEC